MKIRPAEYVAFAEFPEWDGNPLIATLGAFRGDEELVTALYRNPFAGRRLDLAPHFLDAMLNLLTTHAFVVTPQDHMMAINVQRMLYMGLVGRDPSKSSTWSEIKDFASFRGKDIDAVPWNATWADAARLAEITGMGKTHRLTNILRLWPNAIAHGPVDSAQWIRYLQLVWLYVDMSYDGNLYALLLHILKEVDVALDHRTSYAVDIPKRARNVSQLQVWVIDVLKRHFCGVLWIDEMQAISLVRGKDSALVMNFFLRLMNQGIPIIFSGNPFAFSGFESNAQLMDRITAVPMPSLLPKGRDDDDAVASLAPGLWKMQVLPEVPELTPELLDALFDASAWHPRHLARAIVNGQRIALLEGRQSMTSRHVADGFRFNVDTAVAQRIQAFVRKDPLPLLSSDDIPVYSLAIEWKVSDKAVLARAMEHDQPTELEEVTQAEAKNRVVRPRKPTGSITGVIKRAKRRTARKLAKKTAVPDTSHLPEDDLRRTGFGTQPS